MNKIPKLAHFIWIGPKPAPASLLANAEKCRRLNPDFAVQIWSEDRLDFDSSFVKCAYMVEQWSRASNYFRFQILSRRGGIYLDADMEPLRPFAPLLGDRCFVGFQQTQHSEACVNAAIVGAVPGHWLPGEALQRLARKMTGIEPVDDSTGPGNVTHVLIDHGLNAVSADKLYVGDVAVYPPRFFYPYHWTDRPSQPGNYPDAYAVHHWAASWLAPPRLATRASNWANRRVPGYWRLDRAVRPMLRRFRRSPTVLAPLTSLLAARFDRRMRRGLIRSAATEAGV